MAFFYRDNLRQRPNFAIMGTEIPERLRRSRPAWTGDPPVIPPRNPDKPFSDPPRPTLELDPPERNPYNDPDYSPFIVTENLSANAGDKPDGGLLGMLHAMMQQGQVQPVADPGSTPNGSQGGLLGRWLALNDERARNAVDAYGDNGSGVSRVAQAYTTPPQESPAVSEKPVRILSRRLVR